MKLTCSERRLIFAYFESHECEARAFYNAFCDRICRYEDKVYDLEELVQWLTGQGYTAIGLVEIGKNSKEFDLTDKFFKIIYHGDCTKVEIKSFLSLSAAITGTWGLLLEEGKEIDLPDDLQRILAIWRGED